MSLATFICPFSARPRKHDKKFVVSISDSAFPIRFRVPGPAFSASAVPAEQFSHVAFLAVPQRWRPEEKRRGERDEGEAWKLSASMLTSSMCTRSREWLLLERVVWPHITMSKRIVLLAVNQE